MKDLFDNPIAPKEKKSGQYPFDFKGPSYDNRTSCSIQAGSNYGSGFKNPIGKDDASFKNSPIPQTSRCFNPDEIFKYQDKEG